MKIIKNINNNFALAEDKNGDTLIVRGKGIGFGTVPREIEKRNIERSYYDVDENYISMINSIPEPVIEISQKIVDRARITTDDPISSNIIFTLADHINFSIERYKKSIQVKLPIVYDIQHLFEKEYELGVYGLKLIRKEMKCYLPDEEANYIALHLINAEEQTKNLKGVDEDELIENVTEIIEKEYDIKIDRENINYSRFVSHMYYLMKRSKSKHFIKSDNTEIYEKLKNEYSKTYQVSEIAGRYFEERVKLKLTDEEKLYLMLHINRLCTREERD